MRRVGHCGRRPRALVWTRGKITDRRLPQRVPAEELAEDEAFFSENDFDPTAAFIQSLERDRALLEEKERIGQQTPEWQEVRGPQLHLYGMALAHMTHTSMSEKSRRPLQRWRLNGSRVPNQSPKKRSSLPKKPWKTRSSRCRQSIKSST